MNVLIATVAKDVGYQRDRHPGGDHALHPGHGHADGDRGKVGSMLGRRRGLPGSGCVIYGVGSLTTALAPNLAVLVLGWSVLEGIGAALILPAIVALVAGNSHLETVPGPMGW
jgi:hypothetical protein